MDTPSPTADSAAPSALVFVTRAIRKTGPMPGGGNPLPSAVTLAAPPEPPPPSAPPRPTARLLVVRGERPERAFPLIDGKNFVGRTADFAVDIDLDGQETPERTWASRRHAVVTVDAGGVWVEDLHSLNGTFVNRNRLHPGVRKPIRPGDVVQVGTVQLKLTVS